MIELEIIETVLEEQQQDLETYAKRGYISRSEESEIDLNSSMAQVVIGVRRSGKSVLCYNAIRQSGVKFAYVNFDDDRFAKVETSDFDNIMLVLHKLYGNFEFLFLDEAQDVDGWHLLVNRLLRRGMHIIITGSNAKLLSGELATHLTGRSMEITLYPFSFENYCSYYGVNATSQTTSARAERLSLFDDYLQKGGFPELLTERKHSVYINSLVSNIINNDLVRRHKIRNKASFEMLVNHLLNTAPCEVSTKELSDALSISSHHTLLNYISYAEKAFLVSQCSRWSPKSIQRMHSPKVYPIDVTLMNNRKDALVGRNLGFRLETIVYIELMRRHQKEGKHIMYYKERLGECDFLVCQGANVEEAVQVSYDIVTPKTLQREIKGLILASQKTHCKNLTLITRTHRQTVEEDGREIQIVPAFDWLINKSDIFAEA